MSIATGAGDNGTTGLMYNRRVSKCHPRVEAYGTVDELNAALGVVRACSEQAMIRDHLGRIQKDLIILMGELATPADDLPRYEKEGYLRVTKELTSKLDQLVKMVESKQITTHGWATPGTSVVSAALDMARTVCRRAERRVCALLESNQLSNVEIIVYLNRLSDALWLLARWTESQAEAACSKAG